MPLYKDWYLLNSKHFIQSIFIKVDDYGAINVESWCGFVSVRPTTHTTCSGPIFGYIYLAIFDIPVIQVSPRSTASSTPGSAVQDNASSRFRRWRRHTGFVGSCGLWFQLFQDIEEYFVIRLVVDVILNINIANNTCFIDDKNGALGPSVITEDTKFAGNFTVRVKIAEQWIGYAAKAVCPSCQAGNAIYGKAQNLCL